jgi:hypothetical protein
MKFSLLTCWIQSSVLPFLVLQIIDEAEATMKPADDVSLPYRVLHLPLAFNEKWTQDAICRCVGLSRRLVRLRFACFALAPQSVH